MRYAQYVLKSSAVFTGLKKYPEKGCVAVAGNEIIYVGEEQGCGRIIAKDTEILDVGDCLIIPGFFDAHVHLFVGAATGSKYVCTDIMKAVSAEECVGIVSEYAKQYPYRKRIVAYGWYEPFWKKKGGISKKILDEAVGDRPVYLYALDGHSFWLNSKALEECGIDRHTEVEFGKIEKGKDDEPTGLLIEMEACGIAEETAIFNFPDEVIKALTEKMLKNLSSYGITSVGDMANMPKPGGSYSFYKVLKMMEEKEELPVRMHLCPSLGTDGNFDIVSGLREKYHSDMLRISGLKQFVDGISGNYTAYMLEPYSDRKATNGILNYPKEMYNNVIAKANEKNFGVHLHTLGDGGVRVGLNAFEYSKKVNGSEFRARNSLEHCEVISPEDMERFAELDISCSVQPIHIILDNNEKIEKVGIERGKYAWPFKSLLETGANLAFGTDFPVAGINPLEGIYAAVTRCDIRGQAASPNSEEKITLGEAIRAYTYGAAYSHGFEDKIGTLEAGKYADITVIDKNLFECTPDKFIESRVVLTICDGKITYDNREG